MSTRIDKEDFLDTMGIAAYAIVSINEGKREIFAKVEYDKYYALGQPTFIDVSDDKNGNHVYLGKYLDDENTQYYYHEPQAGHATLNNEREYSNPWFTIESSNPSLESIEIMFLQPIEFD